MECVMRGAVGGKESVQKSSMSSSPRRERAGAKAHIDTDGFHANRRHILADIEAQLEPQSNSRPSRTASVDANKQSKHANMEEKPPEKAMFSWSRIRESPAFAAHLRTSDTRGSGALTFTPDRLSPINGGLEVERSSDENEDERNPEKERRNHTRTSTHGTPRPPSSIYDQDDTLAPPSPVHQSSLSLRLPEKQHINYSRPSSPRSHKPSRAPSSLYDNADTLQPPTPTHQSPTPRSWERMVLNFPPTEASLDCTPRMSTSLERNHHPGTEYQPSRPRRDDSPDFELSRSREKDCVYHNHRPSSSPPPIPRPPLYQPRRQRSSNRRPAPSFLLPMWVLPRMRKKYRKRLSGGLFALFFVGTLGTGIGFLIAGVGDDRRVHGKGNGEDVGQGGQKGGIAHRIPWMIAAGGSILGLHGCFVIVMLVLYGPSCF